MRQLEAKLVRTVKTPKLKSKVSSSIIGVRSRLATCSGVAWGSPGLLAVINLAGNSLHLYTLSDKGLTLIQEIVDIPGIVDPAGLAFSPDGTVLAITSSRDNSAGNVHFFAVDLETQIVNPKAIASLKCPKDTNAHGIAFTPDSQMFLYTTIDWPGVIQLLKIDKTEKGFQLHLLQTLQNQFSPIKAKGIAVSPNGKFVAIGYGPNAGVRLAQARGQIAIYSLDMALGLGQTPISISSDKFEFQCVEDVSFSPDSSYVAASDQGADKVVIINFDSSTGLLGQEVLTLKNPQAQLSFPHGNSVSPDGKYLAVANYGSDMVKIYQLGN